MKKFVVLLVVVAMTCISGMAFAAAEVSVSGEMAIRSRDFRNLDFSDKNPDSKNQNTQGKDFGAQDTQSRVRLDVNAKAGDVKGKLSIWNDFDSWGRFEEGQADGVNASGGYTDPTKPVAGSNPGFLTVREAWINFNLPGIPVNVTGGHQLLQLGQGWFFRSMHYGSDAWVVANATGNNTVALVDVKTIEGGLADADDVDAYVLLDVFKIDDNNTVGIDITQVRDRRALLSKAFGLGAATSTEADLTNVGLNYAGKLGPVNLKAEIDLQTGSIKNGASATEDRDFSGNQVVVQATIPMDAVTINATIGRGTGNKAVTTGVDKKNEGFVSLLDVDPHYTFLYEYKVATKGNLGKGFTNTTAVGVGASFKAIDTLTLGADIWMLQATEKVANVATGSGTTSDLGTELDVKANWKLADNLSWNWTLGYLKAGDGLGKDAATGIQGILSMTF